MFLDEKSYLRRVILESSFLLIFPSFDAVIFILIFNDAFYDDIQFAPE